jgi:hypothetical protein
MLENRTLQFDPEIWELEAYFVPYNLACNNDV